MLFAPHCGSEFEYGSAAFAESEGGTQANTQFTKIPGVMAQAPVHNAPAAQKGQIPAKRAYRVNWQHFAL